MNFDSGWINNSYYRGRIGFCRGWLCRGSFDAGGGHVVGQWSDADAAYVLTSFGDGATDEPSPTTYATLALLFAAAEAILAPFVGPTSPEKVMELTINANPEHVLVQYNSELAVWQIADFGPGGTNEFTGSYATLLLAFAAAAALF
jgi:hypothetical protein